MAVAGVSLGDIKTHAEVEKFANVVKFTQQGANPVGVGGIAGEKIIASSAQASLDDYITRVDPNLLYTDLVKIGSG